MLYFSGVAHCNYRIALDAILQRIRADQQKALAPISKEVIVHNFIFHGNRLI
jgi:hypothetical protein